MALVEPLDEHEVRPAKMVEKINELVAAHNDLFDHYEGHVHYSREMQFPTGAPDDNNP